METKMDGDCSAIWDSVRLTVGISLVTNIQLRLD